VALCPDPDEDKWFKLFIGAVSKTTKESNVWATENVRLRTIGDSELIGWDEPLYAGTMRRLCRPKMTAAQAVLAGIYVLTIAEESSNYVGGDTSVAVIRENGIWMESQDYVRSMEKRLHDYERQINDVFLACANTEVSPEQLGEKLSQFAREALSLHKAHLDRVVRDMVASGLNTQNSPYPKIPPGTVLNVSPQGVTAAYDSADKQAIVKSQVDAAKQVLRGVREQLTAPGEPKPDSTD
jgi:hypothetical protein